MEGAKSFLVLASGVLLAASVERVFRGLAGRRNVSGRVPFQISFQYVTLNLHIEKFIHFGGQFWEQILEPWN